MRAAEEKYYTTSTRKTQWRIREYPHPVDVFLPGVHFAQPAA
jgi:hypothetical protein